MEFDDIVVKESPGLCRCCLSEGCYKDLATEYIWMSETEVYADMLMECFDISISQLNEGPNGPNRLICEVCITRLRDACNFKKQVLDSEKKFIDMVAKGDFQPKVVIYQSQMKPETSLEEPVMADDAEVEYLDEDFHNFDDEDLLNQPDQSANDQGAVSEDITVAALPVKGKRGRPRKNPTTVKTEKRAKVARLDDKPKTSKAVSKGEHATVSVAKYKAASKSSMSATKRNRLMKRNAIIVLETSTAMPFKWHRQNYLCFYCHRAFKEPEPLRLHTEREHTSANIKSAVSYLRRDEKVKIDVSILMCKVCQKETHDLNALIAHIKVTHNESFSEEFGYGLIPYKLNNDAFQCAVCEQQFQYFIKLNQHMNEHYGSYICELCGKSFLSQDRLRCHALSHGARHRCNWCAETFHSLTHKNKHEFLVHDKDKARKCFFCDRTFPNYAQRKLHHSADHGVEVPRYDCSACGKQFHIMSKMKVHYNEVHVREKNFSCTVCDQRFFSRTHVQKHMIRHFGERIYQCAICKKSYARKQTLRDHMRIHNNDKRYICCVCEQAFVQNNSLRLHMRVHHPETVNAQSL